MNAAVPLKKIPVLKLVLVIRNKSNQDIANYLSKPGAKVYREQVSLWVNGRGEPTREQAEKIAEFLNWGLEEIWDEAIPTVQKKRAPKEKIGPAKLVDEGALKLGDNAPAPVDAYSVTPLIPKQRRLRLVDDIDPSLELIENIDQGDDQVEIGLYPESVAATQLDRLDPDSELRKIWIPARLRKVQGAKLRAIAVSGYSMNKAGFVPGSIAFFVMKTRHRDGSIAIVEEHGGVTLKRIRGQRAVAESDRSYPEIMLGEDARHVGTVVAIWLPK